MDDFDVRFYSWFFVFELDLAIETCDSMGGNDILMGMQWDAQPL